MLAMAREELEEVAVLPPEAHIIVANLNGWMATFVMSTVCVLTVFIHFGNQDGVPHHLLDRHNNRRMAPDPRVTLDKSSVAIVISITARPNFSAARNQAASRAPMANFWRIDDRVYLVRFYIIFFINLFFIIIWHCPYSTMSMEF